MHLVGRVALLLIVGAYWCVPASGQQAESASRRTTNGIQLDVVVAPKSGPAVAGLTQPDFTVLDNGVQRAITAFRAVRGGEGAAEVLIVIDAVNAKAETVAYERDEVDKILRGNGGRLPRATTFAVFTEVGTQIHPEFTKDGNALAAALKSENIRLPTLSQGYTHSGTDPGNYPEAQIAVAKERRELSLKALETIAAHEAGRPGRKLVLWISPGWPLFSGTDASLIFTSVQRQQMFARMVSLSTELREARITLYSIDPLASHGVEVRDFSYQAYLKGVSSGKNLEPANLGLQVFAVHSGGLVLSAGNNLAELLQKCLADTETYYEIAFEGPAASRPDEYHRLEIKLAKPGLKARTRENYYAQPSNATDSTSINPPSADEQ